MLNRNRIIRLRPTNTLLAASIVFAATSGVIPTILAQDEQESNVVALPEAVEMIVWSGTVAIPNGQTLDFNVNFAPVDSHGHLNATIDIPAQGAMGLELSDVVYSDSELSFTIAVAGAVFSATIDPDDATKATGELKQSGLTLPLTLNRVGADEAAKLAAGPARPQTPQPPFPYTATDVSYTNAEDGTTLAATLTIPDGDGPHPALVLITGSGAQDRDETLLGHKSFAVLADHLARHGIATLRADDRGVGGSSGNTNASTTEDFAFDALAGVAFLKTSADVDASHIGLMGHSEGGIVGPLAATKSDDISFVVMLAGTGHTGRDILIKQLGDISLSGGMTPEMVVLQQAAQTKLLDLLMSKAPHEEVKEAFRQLTYLQVDPENADNPDAIDETLRNNIEAAIEPGIAGLQTPWFRYFLAYDPTIALTQVSCPVLAVNGTRDTQVDAEYNLPIIEETLKGNGNTDVTIKRFEGLNHLFQMCETGSPAEYATIEETFNPNAMEYITSWIESQTGLK